MIEVVFLLKFHNQIKRTRPEVFSFLEKAITEQAEASGAKVRHERCFIITRFDESAPALALDLLLLIEKIQSVLAVASPHIYGWKTAVLREPTDNDLYPFLPALFRAFSTNVKNIADNANVLDGIWCHTSLREELEEFIQFGDLLHFEQGESTIYAGDFVPVDSIKPIKKQDCGIALRKRIIPLLEEKKFENCLIIAPPSDSSGKNVSFEFLARQGQEDTEPWIQDGFSPLVIRFGAESAGLGCFSASLTAKIQRLLAPHVSTVEMARLLSLCAIINRYFLSRQISLYLFENARTFFSSLLLYYFTVADNLKKRPFILLENIQNAAAQATKIFFSALDATGGQNYTTVLGTSVAKGMSAEWQSLFKHLYIVQSSEAVQQSPHIPELPEALWEIAYMICLFRKYFPYNELRTLFYEEGKNEIFLERAFFMLEEYGLVHSKADPQIPFPGFEKGAAAKLGDRAIFVQNIISRRLYAWLSDGRLKVSFYLIVALHELGNAIDNQLLLDSITNDVTNGTFLFIKKNIKNGMFDHICGAERAASLRFIFEALKVLLFGNERAVKNVFASIERDRNRQKNQITLYQTEESSIIALFWLGMNDRTAAKDAAKRAVMLCQGDPKSASLSRVYRIMALVNLSSGQLSDTMDYIAFAIDNATKCGDHNELALSGYYASGIHYLYGNISKALRLIVLAKKSAADSGRMEWLARSSFFEGRIMFETGNYTKALSILEDLLKGMDGKTETNAYKTISAWIYRCKIYLDAIPPDVHIERNIDFALFEIEACYFAGDYNAAVQKAAAFIENIPEPAFQFTEQPDWSSGFAGFEFILFDKKDFLVRFATAYCCLAMCRLDKTNAAGAVRDIEYSMRNERFNGSDPNNPFLFYAYFQVLEEAAAPEVDKNTAISMAFKCLQSRASRIDDLYTKRNYLNLPFWNKLLYQTAKDYKLI
jgi:tetratricopeptide (TPR) repeat protein